MSRPSNLIYGVADQPSAAICLCSAAQLAVLIGPPMIYPIFVMRETGATDAAIAHMISLSLLALGFAVRGRRGVAVRRPSRHSERRQIHAEHERTVEHAGGHHPLQQLL